MLKFKIFEIPEGQSERSVQLGNEDLDLGELPFKGGTIDIEFSRTIQFVRAKLDINAFVEVICDRSLDAFDYEVDKTYEVLFKAEQVEESADENGAIRNYDHKSKQIDLEQDVRDTLLLELPVKKLHPRFLDQDGNPIEYFNQKFGETLEEDEDKIDPRWEVLKELKN
tara:strand:- start:4855 stop:5358 length:504 start_codon:yes stop_codon:yes gene_type:complete